ncbi:signal peptidase I [Parabacteroides sp. OttesenSCG-928-G07]|nr:signal peptidase I [Parabacteroides sp. OttesenSCG-928-G07]
MKKNKRKYESLVNLVFYISNLFVLFLLLQIFLFSSFKIPSDSMSPSLYAGDNILVCKPIVGARLFNIFDALDNQEVEIYRTPGMRKIKRNDVIVFNFPYRNAWDKIEMHIMQYYVKRCIGVPGDTLRTENGIFKVNHSDEQLGNPNAQQNIFNRPKDSFSNEVYHTFPFDTVLDWNIKDFGPLYIPKKGDNIPMNRSAYLLYKNLIEWEQKTNLIYSEERILLNDEPITSYTFQKNYYFVVGDRTEDSQDSRYWGMLPEEFIVGKAWIIWKSVDPYTGAFRWDRFLKKIS